MDYKAESNAAIIRWPYEYKYAADQRTMRDMSQGQGHYISSEGEELPVLHQASLETLRGWTETERVRRQLPNCGRPLRVGSYKRRWRSVPDDPVLTIWSCFYLGPRKAARQQGDSGKLLVFSATEKLWTVLQLLYINNPIILETSVGSEVSTQNQWAWASVCVV